MVLRIFILTAVLSTSVSHARLTDASALDGYQRQELESRIVTGVALNDKSAVMHALRAFQAFGVNTAQSEDFVNQTDLRMVVAQACDGYMVIEGKNGIIVKLPLTPDGTFSVVDFEAAKSLCNGVQKAYKEPSPSIAK